MAKKDEQFTKKLLELLSEYDEGVVRYSDIKEVVDEFARVLRDTEKRMDAKLQSGDTSVSAKAYKDIQDAVKELTSLSNGITDKFQKSEKRIDKEIRDVNRALDNAVQWLRDLIPDTVDVDGLERRLNKSLAALEEKANKSVSETEPDAIRDKLESLSDDDRLDASAIRGLEEKLEAWMKEVKKQAQGGGANASALLSQPRHEEFAMDGATTYVTLQQAVAANGNAIIVRYQGQTLDMTTHYTVNGNKVTLVDFTPADETVISITYWPWW